MKKILAFAGSNSSTSINQRLLDHITGRIQGHEIKMLQLTNFPLPVYDEDIEKESGIPMNAKIIHNYILDHDALIIAVNEHNVTASAFFMNFIRLAIPESKKLS